MCRTGYQSEVVRQTWMRNRVVGRRLRIRRRELFEGWGCARAEDVAAFVVLEHDHDGMHEPRNADGRRGIQGTCEHHGGGDGSEQRKNEAHDDKLVRPPPRPQPAFDGATSALVV